MLFGRIAAILGVAILLMTLNVLASVLYMILFGHFIAPGHDAKYYQDHIQVAAPYCGIVAGIPLMFLAGWWVTGWWQKTHGIQLAIGVWIAYAAIDLALLSAIGLTFQTAVLFTVSFATKLAAVWYGAILRSQHRNVASKVES